MTLRASLALTSCVLAILGSPAARAAGDSFWFPISDGTRLVFDTSGRWNDSTGASGVDAPFREEIAFSAIDEQILDHRATLYGSNDWYLTERTDGYYRVSLGNPNDNGKYRYFLDPEPFLLKTPLDVGQSMSFSGLRRGQWGVPGGGYEAWSGTWSLKLTNVGHEFLTTPLGTFDAAKLLSESVVTVDSRDLFPLDSSRHDWTEYQWFVDGLGIVKIEGSGTDASDFDGDGTVDHWRFEALTMVAVPEPDVTGMLAGGMLLVSLAVARRRQSARRTNPQQIRSPVSAGRAT